MSFLRCIRLAVPLLALLALAGCSSPKIATGPVEAAELREGRYEGSAKWFPVKATVEVTVTKRRITNVRVLKHRTSWKGKKPQLLIPKRIVAAQSTEVDAVSGATVSSVVLMSAAQEAIEKAYADGGNE
jgi:uncharacterized protein with FMN-binding domain